MTKEQQDAELLTRVRRRLLHGPYPQLGVRADEIVAGFLVCLEELQEMRRESEASRKRRAPGSP